MQINSNKDLYEDGGNNLRKIFKRFLLPVLVMLIIFAASALRAEGADYLREVLYFDEDGSFYMTTHDAKGTKSTRYCTLGWTVKKYDLPIDDERNISAVISLTCDGSVEDPEDDRYLYSFFYCDRETIFQSIGAVSEAWQRELYLDGATVYLDGIMTVLENGVPQGTLFADGSISGEVYDTYEGILGARSWGTNSRSSLGTHFNKSVYFPAVESFFEETEEESIIGRIEVNYNRFGPVFEESVSVTSGDYDVGRAIPSGEAVRADGRQQAYAYSVQYEKRTGTVECEVPVVIRMQTINPEAAEEAGNALHSSEVSRSCIVGLPYTYYCIKSIELYYADGICVRSDAFGGASYWIDCEYEPDIELDATDDRAAHVRINGTEEAIEVNIGDITDGEAIEERIRLAVCAAVKPEVRNDYLSIDGFVLMEDSWTLEAVKPCVPYAVPYGEGSRSITIPMHTVNGSYEISADASYGCVVYPGSDSRFMSRKVRNTERINVHTPVVCNALIHDSREWNQLVRPAEEYASLVLGKSFSTEILQYGTHMELKGYGRRSYDEYTAACEVCFPFEIILGNRLIEADTWITLEDSTEFVLPVTVTEGIYTIEYRSIAYNYDKDLCGEPSAVSEPNANLSEDNYIAYMRLQAEVSGQLYDLHINETVEYKKLTNKQGGWSGATAAEMPFAANEGRGLPTGSWFRFSLKSLGSYSEEARVVIVPSFYYISQRKDVLTDYDNDNISYRAAATDITGGIPEELQRVDLYYETITASGQTILRKWEAEESELGADSRTCMDSAKRYQEWNGIYMLPMRLYCIPAGTKLPPYGIDRDFFLEDGYIFIKFDIYVEGANGANRLSYINKENAGTGCCNRWRTEGGSAKVSLLDGRSIRSVDGTVIIYDLSKSVRDQMKITGTH